MDFNNILVTTDFSEDSEKAFKAASDISKLSGANSKITLFTSVSDWVVPDSFYQYIPNPVDVENYRKVLVENASQKLNAYKEKFFKGQKVSSEVVLSIESVAHEICEYARKHSINLIVIGSHGRGAVGTVLLGSVTQKVVKLAPCPVLVVPKSINTN